MPAPLTTNDLQVLAKLVDAQVRAAAPGARPRWEQLRDRLAAEVAARAGEPRWGARVFALELPLELAPTLNRYGSMKPWQRAKLYTAIDWRIVAELSGSDRWPEWQAKERRRAVRVVRYSSARVDELGVDVLGGKVPVDRLVQRGILAGDAAKHLVRAAEWRPAKPNEGRLLVEVHELTP